jgi:acyl-CoA synthetase (AMP-forming)/AMP-acid ligase II
MMGYARASQDLARADEQRGALLTGDLGHLDPDGNLHIDGRMSRICKILDERINLDELERCFADLGDFALAGDDRRITLFHTGTFEKARLVGLIDAVARKVRVPRSVLEDVQVGCIPRTSSGKVSYRDLQEYVSPCDPPKSD